MATTAWVMTGFFLKLLLAWVVFMLVRAMWNWMLEAIERGEFDDFDGDW